MFPWALGSAARTHKEVCVRQQLDVGHQVVGGRTAAAHRRLIEVALQVAARPVERPRGIQPAAYGLARKRARLRYERMIVAHHHACAVLCAHGRLVTLRGSAASHTSRARLLAGSDKHVDYMVSTACAR